MFETIAFLSTLASVGVFVALFQMDRAGRKDEQDEDLVRDLCSMRVVVGLHGPGRGPQHHKSQMM